jgi:hypothetical protein
MGATGASAVADCLVHVPQIRELRYAAWLTVLVAITVETQRVAFLYH